MHALRYKAGVRFHVELFALIAWLQAHLRRSLTLEELVALGATPPECSM
jgi:hypothetical protein